MPADHYPTNYPLDERASDILIRLTTLETKLVAAETIQQRNNDEIQRLRDWRHDNASPMLQIMQNNQAQNIKSIERLTENIDRVTAVMGTLSGLPKVLHDHQDGCIEARHEDLEHRGEFEKHVNLKFDKLSEQQRTMMLAAIGTLATWVIMGTGSLIYMILEVINRH